MSMQLFLFFLIFYGETDGPERDLKNNFHFWNDVFRKLVTNLGKDCPCNQFSKDSFPETKWDTLHKYDCRSDTCTRKCKTNTFFD